MTWLIVEARLIVEAWLRSEMPLRLPGTGELPGVIGVGQRRGGGEALEAGPSGSSDSKVPGGLLAKTGVGAGLIAFVPRGEIFIAWRDGVGALSVKGQVWVILEQLMLRPEACRKAWDR